MVQDSKMSASGAGCIRFSNRSNFPNVNDSLPCNLQSCCVGAQSRRDGTAHS